MRAAGRVLRREAAGELLFESADMRKWWDSRKGPFAQLHAINPARLRFVQRVHPLGGARALDIGCGGGLLAEPMARAGANVLAIDQSENALNVARAHAEGDPLIHRNVQYENILTSKLRAIGYSGSFDIAVASEVLEHVDNVESTLSDISALLKPGGSAVFTTINRTALSYLAAIQAAENLVRIVPQGTHSVRCTIFLPVHVLCFCRLLICV